MRGRQLLLAVIVVAAVSMSQQAQGGGIAPAAQNTLGIGIIVGEPTGVSVKKWLSDTRAIDAAAGWSFSENESLQLHADYLIHNFTLPKPGELKGEVPWYYGVGGRIKLEDGDGRGRNADDTLVGVRVPVGISYLFSDATFEFFIEIVPLLDLVPDTDFDFNAALGVRYYFNK